MSHIGGTGWGEERDWWRKNPPRRNKNVFTVREICDRTGYVPWTIRQAIREGKLQTVPAHPNADGLEKRWHWVTKKSLEEWLLLHPKAAVAAQRFACAR